MDTALGLAAVAALILANGWFVLAEFSYVAARRPHLEEAAERGDRRAARALEILRRLSFMLSGAQLGITATSLLIGYLSERVFSRVLGPLVTLAGVPDAAVGPVALATGLVLATGTQMVLGELAPKNLGIAKPERFSLALAGPLRAYLTLAGPLIRLFDGSANALLKAVGIEPMEELRGGMSPEELGLVISESGAGGVLTSAQAHLLTRVLAFRELDAADAMVARPQVVAVAVDASCEDLRRLAVETGHSRFPVVGEGGLDEVRGVVQAKDVLRIPPARRAATPVSALASKPLVVPESAQLSALLGELRAAHSPIAVVVDEHGGTSGIVTLEDLIEELVGQIRDEYDQEEPAAVPLAGGDWLVPGSWRPDEVARDTGIELPPGDYETVSGLVMARLGRVPGAGDTVDLDGLRIRVEEMLGHAVELVRLMPASRPEDAVEPGEGPGER
jgi:CBS domain containing-hemolysin-like protein